MKPLPTWRHLAGMARYRPSLYLLHAVLWGTLDLSTLVTGLVASTFFDTLTGRAHPLGGTAGLVGLLAAIAVGRAVVWLSAGFVEIVLRFTMSGLVRRNLLRHILDRAGAHALPFSIGETISRFRDDAHQAEDNLDWTDEILVHGLFAVVAFLVLLHVDARMTLVVIVPMIAVVAAARRASAALGRYRAASSEATSQVTGAIGDILAAAQTLQAAGAEERVVARFRSLNEQRRRAMLADRLATQALDAITANAVSVGTGLVMLLASATLRDGSLSVGGFVLFVSYLALITGFIDDLGRFLAHYGQTGVAFARMGALLDPGPPCRRRRAAPATGWSWRRLGG
jgi:ATP-binding cassette subfamily B protein